MNNSICLSLAVDTAVNFIVSVCQLENMLKLLLAGGYTSRVFALDNIYKLFGHLDNVLINENAVFYDIDSYIGIDVADNIKAYGNIGVDFDNILFAHFAARDVFDYRNRAVELVKTEKLIQAHTVACRDMVDDNTVIDRIYIHFAASSKSIRMSAILIYLPLSTCLK